MLGMPNEIRALADAQGWSPDTLLGLVCSYIDEKGQTPDLLQYLNARSDEEEGHVDDDWDDGEQVGDADEV